MDLRQLWLSGQEHAVAGRLDQACSAFESLLASAPTHVGARLFLSSVLLAQGRVRAATEQLKFAAFALPDDITAVCQVAQALAALGETNAARACLRHPAIAASRSAPSLAAIAQVFQSLGLNAEALQLMRRARALGLDTPDFRYFFALQLQFNGELDAATEELEACLRAGPTFGRASLTLARIRRQTAQDNHVDFLRARLLTVAQGSEDHAAFEFALHKELADLGDDDAAWAALARGNAVMAGRLRYDAAAEERVCDGLMRRFDAAFLAHAGPHNEGPQPIFIVGMPRSGTTLLERILGSHPQVASAGELTDLPRQLRWVADRHGHALLDDALLADLDTLDYAALGRRYLEQSQWRAQGRRYYVDKLPPNFQLMGCIRRALPQARIIHMQRDPMALCFSNYRALFGDTYAYSYDFASLAHHHGQYRRLMRHWREVMPEGFLDLSYARLVRDTEDACRALLDYCGLAFAPECLDHTRNPASVATLSSAQVREPINTRGLDEWRRYATQLEPLRRLVEPDAA
jgi:tetratricopeptide (TPR) repeat protein